MPRVSIQHLIRESLGRPIRHNVQLTGAYTGRPGVTAVISRERKLGWCLLADHPDNRGVSVTNGALEYAEAICRALECSLVDLAWFELDSEGKFDELHVHGASAGFAALIEDGCAPRSWEAFSARVARLPGGFPDEAAVSVKACLDTFKL